MARSGAATPFPGYEKNHGLPSRITWGFIFLDLGNVFQLELRKHTALISVLRRRWLHEGTFSRLATYITGCILFCKSTCPVFSAIRAGFH